MFHKHITEIYTGIIAHQLICGNWTYAQSLPAAKSEVMWFRLILFSWTRAGWTKPLPVKSMTFVKSVLSLAEMYRVPCILVSGPPFLSQLKQCWRLPVPIFPAGDVVLMFRVWSTEVSSCSFLGWHLSVLQRPTFLTFS